MIVKTLLFVTFTFAPYVANSQEKSGHNSAIKTQTENAIEEKLLKQAKLIKNSDVQESIKLANETLQLSRNNDQIRAQAHSLLGELYKRSNKNSQSAEHFSQAFLIYSNIDDKQNLILSSINHANGLYNEKRYEDGHKVIDGLFTMTHTKPYELPLALALMTKGNGYYQRKNFNDAIAQYTLALNYLSSNDRAIQKQLGETFTKIAESYKRIKDREKTALYYKKALDVYTVLQDKKLMARTLHTIAEAERYLNSYIIALEYATQGLEIHKEIDDPVGRGKALMGAGIIYRHIELYEKSLQHIHEAYIYYKEINDTDNISATSNQMGLVYTRLKQFDLAKSFYQLTIDLPESKVRPKNIASALREMAVIELNDGNYESAKTMIQRAHKIYQKENDKSKGSLTARIIANIYRAELNVEQAIKYYRESLALATEIGSIIYQIKAQIPLAAMLSDIDTDEAMLLLNQSIPMSISINSKSHLLYATRELRKTEKKRGNYLASLQHAEEEIALTKIIQKDRDDKGFNVAKARTHSHKIEMELQSFKEKTEQERKISELQHTNDRYVYTALIFLLIVCLLVVLLIYRRFEQSKKLNKKLNSLVTSDSLTNCYNRRFLFQFLKQEFSNKDLLDEYCIIMADIDHFKSVNDTYGHSTGDAVIRGVAGLLNESVRQDDIVARYGGEEFCIVLPGASIEKGINIAESIRLKVQSNVFNKVKVTCSFGVSSIKFNAKAPRELIEQADLALYESKNNGRNAVTVWRPSLEK